MTRSWIVLACVGCSGPATTVVDVELTGSYSVHYTAPDGITTTDQRDDIVFNAPTTVPECCLEVIRRTDSTFEILLGNWIEIPTSPGPTGCPRVMTAYLKIDGVAEQAQTLALDSSNTALAVGYDDEQQADPCPRFMPEGVPLYRKTLALTGQLKLETFHCASPPTELGCGLVATGSWALEGADDTSTPVFTTSGSFVSADEAGPVRFD